MTSVSRNTGIPTAPNMFEVVGTTIPLLATILAGFAVTVCVQVVPQDSVRLTREPTGTAIGFTVLLTSAVLFLASAFFAAWAQAHNSKAVDKVFEEVHSEKFTKSSQDWEIYRLTRWAIFRVWYRATTIIFSTALVAFVVGLGLIFAKWVGIYSLVLPGLAILFGFLYGVVVRKNGRKVADERGEQSGTAQPSTQGASATS